MRRYYFETGMKFYFGRVGSYREIVRVFPEEVEFRVVFNGKRPDKRTKTISKRSLLAWVRRNEVKLPFRCDVADFFPKKARV